MAAARAVRRPPPARRGPLRLILAVAVPLVLFGLLLAFGTRRDIHVRTADGNLVIFEPRERKVPIYDVDGRVYVSEPFLTGIPWFELKDPVSSASLQWPGGRAVVDGGGVVIYPATGPQLRFNFTPERRVIIISGRGTDFRARYEDSYPIFGPSPRT